MRIKRVILGVLTTLSVVGLAACHRGNDDTTDTNQSVIVPSSSSTVIEPTQSSTSTTVIEPTQSSTSIEPTQSSISTTIIEPTQSSTSIEPTQSSISTTIIEPTQSSTSTEPTTTSTEEVPPVEEPDDNTQNGLTQGTITSGSGEVVSGTITSCSGANETAYLEYVVSASCDGYNVYLKGSSDSDYSLLKYENQYTQALSETKMRTDVFGLAAGNYSIKVVPYKSNIENEASKYVCNVVVTAYDRSGYAHFNYTEGVGAYNDDGTLKNNAVVIYVTDENKNTVMKDICARYSDVSMFKIPSYFTNDYQGTDAESIGWWLNNAQYTKSEKDKNGVVYTPQVGKKTSDTYDPEGKSLGFYSVCENHPLCIRFVGTVTNPLGTTIYDSYKQGGSEGDNGNMARMKDLRNVTLEGVGNDAIIDGWGFHFMAGDTTGTRGKNFEARNLTFINYTEDALGMEGAQVSDTKFEEGFKAPVNHCWVHHNTFFPGYCASPAESDKAEGDGSCDFKRGYAFTMSYNYFEYCHKTNLIGSSKTSIQYDISFHHNIWYNCGSRIPLMRRSNMHFYNNLVIGDSNTNNVRNVSKIHNTAVSKVSLSYVSSLRAYSYMYSENNYFDGCKQVFETGEGAGAAKCFGNVYVSCYQIPDGNVEVANREATVANTCKNYTNPTNVIDYSSFDTNPNYFYYDAVNKISNCYLTTATIAREECLKFAGSNYRTILDGATLKIATNANKYTPANSIDLTSSDYNLQFTGPKTTTGDSQNIYFAELTGATSTEYKFKNQGITFTVVTSAEITIEMTCSVTPDYACGYLVKSDGTVVMKGSGTCVIEPGTYFITSVYTDKETKVTKLSMTKYDSAEYDAKILENFNNKVAAIPNAITYTNYCWGLINEAKSAYGLLSSTLKAQVSAEIKENLTYAYNGYKELGEAYVSNLIDEIGTVTSASSDKILAARAEYNDLLTRCPDAVVANYSTLTEAEGQFASIAVDACISAIDAIGTVSLSSKNMITLARGLYDMVDAEQKSEITNYSVLVAAEATLANLEAAKAVDDMITACGNTISAYEEVIAAYNALTADQKALVTKTSQYSSLLVNYTIALIDSLPETITSSDSKTIVTAETYYSNMSAEDQALITNYEKLVAARTALNGLLSAQHVVYFNNAIFDADGFFTVTENGYGSGSDVATYTYNSTTIDKPLKLNSTADITFTLTEETEVTIVVQCRKATGSIYVDKGSYDITNSVTELKVTLAAGTHTIKKNSSESYAYVVIA